MKLSIQHIASATPWQQRASRHRTRLAIGPDDIAGTSPVLLLAEDQFAPSSGFPTHPHRSFETVTQVLSGELLARLDASNWMTCAR